jgi:hypothetical protein
LIPEKTPYPLLTCDALTEAKAIEFDIVPLEFSPTSPPTPEELPWTCPDTYISFISPLLFPTKPPTPLAPLTYTFTKDRLSMALPVV